jgi:phosphoserine phosphatase
MAPRFRSVILDADSTLVSIEGIDWLAAQRGPAVAARIAEVTERAMNGEIALEAVYGARLEIVEPDAGLLGRLGDEYLEHVVPGAKEAVRALGAAGVEVAIISGGIRQALLPLAAHLGLTAERLRAVDVHLNESGAYAGYDARSPLATDTGKAAIAGELAMPRPTLMVGDGHTDLAARPSVDAFAAFVGVIRREPVVERADYVISSFDQLTTLILS